MVYQRSLYRLFAAIVAKNADLDPSPLQGLGYPSG